jgi:hypothetical protein
MQWLYMNVQAAPTDPVQGGSITMGKPNAHTQVSTSNLNPYSPLYKDKFVTLRHSMPTTRLWHLAVCMS